MNKTFRACYLIIGSLFCLTQVCVNVIQKCETEDNIDKYPKCIGNIERLDSNTGCFNAKFYCYKECIWETQGTVPTDESRPLAARTIPDTSSRPPVSLSL